MKWQGLPESKNVEDRRGFLKKNTLEKLVAIGNTERELIDRVINGPTNAATPSEAYYEGDFMKEGPASGVDPYKL